MERNRQYCQLCENYCPVDEPMCRESEERFEDVLYNVESDVGGEAVVLVAWYLEHLVQAVK